MAWLSIVTLLLQIFGPIFAEWLRKRLGDRLAQAAAEMKPPEEYGSSAEALDALYDRAIRMTPLLHVGERMALERMRQVALKHADGVMSGGAFHVERDEVEYLREAGAMVEPDPQLPAAAE